MKWEGEGGVKHQLQVLREGHGGGRGGGEVALPKGETLRWRVSGRWHINTFRVKCICHQASSSRMMIIIASSSSGGTSTTKAAGKSLPGAAAAAAAAAAEVENFESLCVSHNRHWKSLQIVAGGASLRGVTHACVTCQNAIKITLEKKVLLKKTRKVCRALPSLQK